ncbi:MAG: O-antigen ligase family protein [Oscillospiraceae bacterium]|nr:O-antigen ligase family protein [Oscillospiraceae bacterium]
MQKSDGELLSAIGGEAFARRAAACLAVFLLSLFLLAVPPVRGGYGCITEFKLVLFAAAALFCALCVLPCALLRRRFDRARAAAWVYFTLAAVSALASPHFPLTLLGSERREGLAVLFLYVAVFLLLSRFWVVRLWQLRVFAACASALCCVCLWQLRGGNPLCLFPEPFDYFGADRDYAGAFIGTVGNADFTAVVLAMALVVCVGAVVMRRGAGCGLFFVCGALCICVLAQLGVASAWAALCVTAAAAPLFVLRRHRALYLAALAAAAACAVFLLVRFPPQGGALGDLSLLLRGEGDGALGSGRVAIWRELLPYALERPLLGTGPDTVWLYDISPFYWTRSDGARMASLITAAHSEYLQILCTQGIFGLLSYLTLLALVLFPRGKRSSERTLCALAAVCYLAWAGFGISACVSAPLFWVFLAGAAEK